MIDTRAVEADFDRIALLHEGGFDHNAVYHDYLMRFLPERIGEAFDLGCGTGDFTRLLAARADRVTALDFSENMLSVARERSAAFDNIEFVRADARSWDWPIEQFDCIASVATLHHIPLEAILPKIAGALRPGGVFLILDIARAATIWEMILGACAFPAAMALRLIRTNRLRPNRELRRAWRQHGQTDQYLSAEEVRQVCKSNLPGATVRRHFLWRYSLVWRKPAVYR